MSFKSTWQNLTALAHQYLDAHEELSLSLSGEESLFLRFNNGKLRQSTWVDQFVLDLLFQKQGRRIQFQVTLGKDPELNQQVLQELLSRCRQEAKILPPDLKISTLRNLGISDFDDNLTSKPPVPEEQGIRKIIDDIVSSHKTDFSGFYSGGPQYRANWNSAGQSHWHRLDSFFYDYSLYTLNHDRASGKSTNKAVKGNLSGSQWDSAGLRANIARQEQLLRVLEKPGKVLKPGAYRAYLAPSAVNEILGTMAGGFSGMTYKQGRSPFAKLAEEKELLSPKFNLYENFSDGFVPRFTSTGDLAPARLAVVENGQFKNWIVSQKTASEFQLQANGGEVSGWMPELMRAPEIGTGSLVPDQILKELGTGIWLGNLHYLNWSDVSEARITGMTRYACFWVENGEIAAPIQDMRFDESLYRIFGSQLLDLTTEQSHEPDISTYYRRELGSRRFPGVLLKEFRFTL